MATEKTEKEKPFKIEVKEKDISKIIESGCTKKEAREAATKAAILDAAAGAKFTENQIKVLEAIIDFSA